MKRLMLILVVVAAAIVVPLGAAAAGNEAQKMAMKPAVYTQAVVDLRNAMRMLWEEHIVYTRTFIISALAGLDDTSKVAERLLKNQDDIGNAIKPYYGDAAGTALAGLLRTHILIAADIVSAAKSGDNDGVANGEKKWSANAEDLATFLSSANSNWPKSSLRDMLDIHLAYTTTEVVSRLSKNWTADMEAYDKGHAHMLMFADMLSDGIVKQFPAKFTR